MAKTCLHQTPGSTSKASIPGLKSITSFSFPHTRLDSKLVDYRVNRKKMSDYLNKGYKIYISHVNTS